MEKIKSATPVNTQMTHTHTKVKQSYCCLGESFSGLDKRSNQSQYSSKLKPSSVGGPSSVQFRKVRKRWGGSWKKSLKLTEVGSWSLRKETVSTALNCKLKQQALMQSCGKHTLQEAENKLIKTPQKLFLCNKIYQERRIFEIPFMFIA